jgi:hypothetical protein
MEPDPYLQNSVSMCKNKQFYIKLKCKFLILLLCCQGVGHHGLFPVSLLDTGFGLVIGFIEQLQIVTKSNYSALANSHTRLLTIAHGKSSMSSLAVACNGSQQCPPLTSLPAGDSLTTNSLNCRLSTSTYGLLALTVHSLAVPGSH